MDSNLPGVLVAVLAGAIGSVTLLPMKFIRRWPWECTWMVYAAHAYLLFPWIAAMATVPGLFSLYHQAPLLDLAIAAAFGLLWGAGVVLFGLAVDIVGLSLTSGIILGCSISVGSLAPLLFNEPERVFTSSGRWIVAADLVIIAGLALCAWAGSLRAPSDAAANVRAHKQRFVFGLVLCLISGMTAPLLNLALTFGASLTDLAKANGASPLWAANSIWAPVVSAGAIPSLAYCAFRLAQNDTWKEFRADVSRTNVAWCVLMGVFFITSTVVYGTAAGMLGKSGEAIGWPVYMSAIILGGNFWGLATGEWKHARGAAVACMAFGIMLQIVGITILKNSQ